MTKQRLCTLLGRASVLILLLCAMPAQAEDEFVLSYKGSNSVTDISPCSTGGGPFSCPAGSFSSFGTTATSAAIPCPINATNRRAIYGTDTNFTYSVTPEEIPTSGAGAGTVYWHALQNVPGYYKMYITRGHGTTTHSTNLVMKVTVSGANTLADTNGIGQSYLSVPFTRASVLDQWIFIGYITNVEASPTVTFSWLSGTVDSSGNRWTMDGVRFYNPGCALPNSVGIDGPLSAGQTFVNVTNVVNGATSLTVYADGEAIGQTNYALGFTGGRVAVPVTPLVKDTTISGAQVYGGCSSVVAPSGPVVGGGANPKLKVFLACAKNSSLSGPIGANGSSTNSAYVLKATNLIAGFNTAPSPGQELLPSANWQTVTFNHASDPALDLLSGSSVTNTDPYCILEGLVFSLDDSDSGPYDIYVDEIVNGSTVVEDFESYVVGSTNTFVAANQAGLLGPSTQYLTSPNFAAISSNHAFGGTKSCRLQFQWNDTLQQRWAHVRASGASGGKVYPQLDTTQSITVHYLILPAGQTPPGNLTYTRSGATLTLTWSDGVLQVANSCSTPNTFCDIPNATSPYVVNLANAGTTKYYRLRGQ